MQGLAQTTRPLCTEVLPQSVHALSAYAEKSFRFLSRATGFARSARGRTHFQTLPASNELHCDSADSLCDDNLGFPTQINNCED